MGLLGKNKEIGPDTIIQRRNDLLFNEIDGEVVMLSIENGEYYGMCKISSRIWEIIEHPITFSNLLIKLLEEYEVEYNNCALDTKEFISTLIEKKLISII